MADKRSHAEGAPLDRFDASHAADFLREHPGRRQCLIAGIDEAGRGPLAGPVVAAAVVFEPDAAIPGVNDSKRLSEKRREQLFPAIHEAALGVGVGVASAEEIDRINVLAATKLAARRALDDLNVSPDLLLLDALRLESDPRPQRAVIKGDAKSQAIAAASIVAKVTRDRLMRRYDEEYPEYGFARHKGYGSAAHIAVLRQIGPSALHRLTFGGVCFFNEECRSSRTCLSLAEEIRALTRSAETGAHGDAQARDSLARRLRSLDGFLPEGEIRRLEALLAGGMDGVDDMD